MNTVYALLVGIDSYRAVQSLHGCANDVRAVSTALSARIAAGTLRPITLVDADATRAAVIERIRDHLGQAGPGDTALFWFSGHGSWVVAPAELAHLEASAQLQTLLCVDSRQADVPDLLDKELSVLLDDVAAGGCQVVAVLDCCHAQSGSRDAAARYVPGLTAPPRGTALLRRYLDRVTAGSTGAGSTRVELAACRADQTAREHRREGEWRGAFSAAMVRALYRSGPATTYRDLFSVARCEIENDSFDQVPQLDPAERGVADRLILGGRGTASPPAPMLRRRGADWEIDVGACHGLVVGEPDAPTTVAIVDAGPLRELRVVRVLPERSTVEPVGWRPDPARSYPIVLSALPTPPTTVRLDGVGADLAALLRAAIGTAGPGDRPSAYLREVGPDGGPDAPDLRITLPRPDTLWIGPEPLPGGRAAGRWPTAWSRTVPADADGALHAVRVAEHVTRWRQIKSLTNPVSQLAGSVTVEVVPARPGESTPVPGRRPIPLGADGLVDLAYRMVDGAWRPPTCFVRIRNDADRPLFCALLDLTDGFTVYTGLFPTDLVAAHHTVTAMRGRPVELSLPPGRPARPGSEVRDWLMLVVAEEQFDVLPFELAALGETPRRGAFGPAGMVERLGLGAAGRDIVAVQDGSYDWTTVTVPLRTSVPIRDGVQIGAPR